MSLYDSFANEYERSENSRGTKYLFDPSVRSVVGDVVGKSVLDFGCGHGYSAREIKLAGASRVVGFDLSEEQIRIARAVEDNNPVDIEYHVLDAIDLPILGQFDVVMAKFVLHYSSSRDELKEMFASAHRNLKPGGRLIALIPDFQAKLRSNSKYDFTTEAPKKVNEGDKIHVVLYLEGDRLCEFDNFHWKKSTYAECARNAGFREIRWHDLHPSQAGIDRFGEEFWQDYLDGPNHTIIEAIA